MPKIKLRDGFFGSFQRTVLSKRSVSGDVNSVDQFRHVVLRGAEEIDVTAIEMESLSSYVGTTPDDPLRIVEEAQPVVEQAKAETKPLPQPKK